ncbi:MAG: segregation ATPase FtsK/SpoIIIE, family [Actinomycetota bacterium]|nr:segregation ATPase FtsK/SpoIIIE, family [Actinomycetota bacterium]
MTTVDFHRPARRPGPPLPRGEISLQEPPSLPEVTGTDLSSALMYLPMMVGSSAMVFLYARPGGSATTTYLVGGLMALSGVGMVLGSMGRGNGERKRRLRGERRDYLRYLTQSRQRIAKVAAQQAKALVWTHPAPSELWSVAGSPRMWERRPADLDFGEIRVGTGGQQLAVPILPPQTKPVEDLEPLCARALRRFVEAHWLVPGLPSAIQLRGFARVLVRARCEEEADGGSGAAGVVACSGAEADGADTDPQRDLICAILAQLATFHSPDDLRLYVCASPERRARWEWVKWLPHAQHQDLSDGAGAQRLIVGTFPDLERLLGASFNDRPRMDDPALPCPDEPYTVVVVDDVPVPLTARLACGNVRNAVLVDASDSLRWSADPLTLRLRVDAENLDMIGTDENGKETVARLCAPDGVSAVRARALARQLSPYRLGSSSEAGNSLATDLDLTALLGIGDPRAFDPDVVRAQRSRWDLLRVPIGMSASGIPVELDIKESAQGGMGPHGMLIGATGSGKSELLRTLVLALAVTHSSETLNFVLVDFKGGATFLGLEDLPHVSAAITNLADELPLVDRMQEALQGELLRRQELLRRTGHSCLRDYEKARAEGVPLEALPTLFVVVDEFSELLATKREFIDLFVMIGRLGRSLGVHLLLASQRVDEGRVHQLESHLSYRIGLRTFSASESRSVIGVPDAYELPSAPGNGFLRADTTTLIRFRAAYVSAAMPTVARGERRAVARLALAPFTAEHVPVSTPVSVPVTPPGGITAPGDEEEGERLLDVVVRALVGHGPRAHRVWLPPLDEAPSLDQLLPPVAEHPGVGLSVAPGPGRGTLRVPVGVIDRPLEQRRDLLLADLTGAGGHVGIGGGPQSGKSTLVRTLVTALALTHTPREVQFFCLDFGGGTLSSLAELPHVSGATGRLDRERVTRTIAEVSDLLTRREQMFALRGIDSMATYRRLLREGGPQPGAGEVFDDGFGDVFLVVDGWSTMRQDFENLESSFSDIVTRGLNYGIHLVITASRWSEIRPWLRDLLGTRFELHLGDPVESEVGMREAANVPSVPGRGLTREGLHFLSALPRIDGRSSTEDLADAGRLLVKEIGSAWTGPTAPAVRMLPAQLSVAELPEPEGTWQVPIGLDERALLPVVLDFDQNPHAMVFGEHETGKTSLLRVIVESIVQRHSPGSARILLADPRRNLFDAVPKENQVGYAVTNQALVDLVTEAAEALRRRLPGPEIPPERISRRDWWVGPHLYVVIDDYDLLTDGMDSPLSSLGDLLPQGREIGLHLIVARNTAGASRAMMLDQVLRRLWELASPALLFSCDREEGAFLGEAKPLRLPPGRAQLVDRRRASVLVQTAMTSRKSSTQEGNNP